MCVRQLHAGGVSSIAIDGVHLLSGGGDGALHLFDLEDLAPAALLRGHGAPISDGLLLPAGSHRARAVSSSVDGAVKLWDATGTAIAELMEPFVHVPPHPLPLAMESAAGPVPRWLFCGREGVLHAMDLQTEVSAYAVPLPARAIPRGALHSRPALHVACSGAEHPGSTAAGGSPHLVASCSLNTPTVHLWDSRLLPAAAGVDEATATFEDLPAASQRCLVASVALPGGAACARQLYLDGARLLTAVDRDDAAPAFSRGAQSAALYDIRAVASGGGSAVTEPGRSSGCLLWEQPVAGDISCLQCRGERVLVGTATGAVHIWSFGRSSTILPAEAWDSSEQPDRKPKREKWRAAPKVRGRFPKTQGFSNAKGFGGR